MKRQNNFGNTPFGFAFSKPLEWGKEMRYAIGIDIGGTKIASGIVNEHGDLIQKEVVRSDTSDKEQMFSQVITCVQTLMNHSSIPLSDIFGIGAGIPGKVDRENGIAVFQNNLPWRDFPFTKRISEALGVNRIVIDNDVDMAAFAEWKKAELTETDLFTYITISTGIACSIIQGGEIIRGAGFAGELGLIPITLKNKGTYMERLESIASGPAIAKRGQDLFKDSYITSADVLTAYHKGDAQAEIIIQDLVSSLTQGLYVITSLLDPHKIVFGGSVAVHNPQLLQLVKEELACYLLKEQLHILDHMEFSHFNHDQGILGSGLKVFNSN